MPRQTNRPSTLDTWIRARIIDSRPRTKSLIVTVFGDSIEPHGGVVWMGSLARLLAPLGIKERATRTSVFRLVQEHWLEAEVRGRRSFYRLTAAGRLRVAHAYRRIYSAPTPSWDGTWTFLLVHDGIAASLRHDLDWEGFGQIGPGLYAHPTPDISALEEVLGEHRTRARITTFSARALHGKQEANLKNLASRSWALDSLARQYRDFLRHYEPLRGRLSRGLPTPEQCFILRTLLIHEFRRVQLRDPQLPPVLLPEDWPGVSARNLCREIYFATAQGAEQHLIESAETPAGALRPAAPYFFERFGGLTQQARSA